MSLTVSTGYCKQKLEKWLWNSTVYNNHLGRLLKMQISTLYVQDSKFCNSRLEPSNVHFE